MKYFRYYPWGLQLLLFLLMIFTMIGFASVMLMAFLPKVAGISLEQIEGITEQTPAYMVKVATIVQGVLSTFIFLVPALLFAYLSHPRPAEYLGLRAPGKGMQVALAILVMLGAAPMLQGLEALVGMIDFGPKIKAAQDANNSMMAAFFKMPDFGAFLRMFTIMAIIPAVGEELFFRGVLLRFVKQRTLTMTAPILFTAIVFAYSHTNIYGYLSIFLAGVLLAVIYNVTGSLWCSIAAHMSFNGAQIVLAYIGNSNKAVKAFTESTTTPVLYIVGGAVLFAASLYLLLRTKTPLAANWSDNFRPDELIENA